MYANNIFTVAWSSEDGEYVATHSAYPSLSWLDENPTSALRGLVNIMDEIESGA